FVFFFFSSRRRHTRSKRDCSSDVCSSDLAETRPWSDFRSRLHRRPRLVSGRLPASVDDLKGHAELFDGKITGIESGAGETEIVKNELIPDYGFEDEYTLQTSSSPAMLAALAKAIDHQKPIVVTLWHPHWAYNKFDIKDLKDPNGAMGEPEKLHRSEEHTSELQSR